MKVGDRCFIRTSLHVQQPGDGVFATTRQYVGKAIVECMVTSRYFDPTAACILHDVTVEHEERYGGHQELCGVPGQSLVKVNAVSRQIRESIEAYREHGGEYETDDEWQTLLKGTPPTF